MSGRAGETCQSPKGLRQKTLRSTASGEQHLCCLTWLVEENVCYITVRRKKNREQLITSLQSEMSPAAVTVVQSVCRYRNTQAWKHTISCGRFPICSLFSRPLQSLFALVIMVWIPSGNRVQVYDFCLPLSLSLSVSLSRRVYCFVWHLCCIWRQSLKNLSSTCPQQS